MRLRGCVAEAMHMGQSSQTENGVPAGNKAERNAEPVLRVSLNTGWLAIPETIDARRGIEEV